MSAHGEFGITISYPLRHIFLFLFFFLHMHEIHRYASIAAVFFLALHHCIVSMAPLNAHQIHNPNLLHEGHSLAYTTRVRGNGQFTTAIRDECGISWIFFGKCQSSRRQETGIEWKRFTDILVKRAISSAETDGLVFFSTHRRCSSRISCFKF